MPELPEVETSVNSLKKELLGLEIIDIWTDLPKAIKNLSAQRLKTKLKGEKILDIQRRAKLIIFLLSNNKILLAHQKMTGHFLVGKWRYSAKAKRKWLPLEQGPLQDKINDYFHLVFWLNDGRQLAFSDLRKFGWIKFYQNIKLHHIPEIKKLGPEPLSPSFTAQSLAQRLGNTRRPIKKALMDPQLLAGIGNIYSDEILFLSRIHPLTPANSLNNQQIKSLHKAIRQILKQAIKYKGTTILSGAEEFRLPRGERGKYQEKRHIYRKTGEPCPVCGQKIKRIKVGQRSSHFCPKCQILPKNISSNNI